MSITRVNCEETKRSLSITLLLLGIAMIVCFSFSILPAGPGTHIIAPITWVSGFVILLTIKYVTKACFSIANITLGFSKPYPTMATITPVLLLSAVTLLTTSCVPSPTRAPLSASPEIVAPTKEISRALASPTATPQPKVTLIQDTQLFSGPGNRNFRTIDSLESGISVTPLGIFGDFVLVSTPNGAIATEGFVWVDALANLDMDLPQLDQNEIPHLHLNLIDEFFYYPTLLRRDNTLEVSTEKEEWAGPEIGPLFLDTPFQVDLSRAFRGSFGAVQFRGNVPPFLTEEKAKVESGEVMWPIPTLIISSDRIEIADKDLSKGNLPFYSIGVPGLATSRITVIFHDAQGRSFSIQDSKGKKLISIDVTKLGSEALSEGLFVHGFYASVLVGPSTNMELDRMTLSYVPRGGYIQNDKQPTFRQLADKHNLLVGTGTITYHLNDLINAGIIADEFNYLIVAQFDWESIQPQKGVFNFRMTDSMIAFAEAHDMKVHCADLIPPSPDQLPEWLLSGSYTRDELIEILHDHITTLVGHYRGRCHTWSVVNEEIARNLSWSGGGYWINRIGYDIFEMAFRWANEADPDAILVLKDTDGYDRDLYWTRKIADEMYRVAQHLVEEGVPIDGVAFQLHILLADNHVPTKAGVTENMRRFEELGLDIYFDEIDVNLGNIRGSQEERWDFQAKIFRDMLEACLELDACRSFSLFNYTDRHSWLGDCENCRYVPNSEAHPFDRYYNPKPAYYAMLEVLSSHDDQDNVSSGE